MGKVIALAGKGGTGKTTIGALIVRLISEKKLGSILAVDADPNSNLAEVLGLRPKETVGTILDKIAKNPDKIPAGMSKDRFIEYEIQAAICEGDGFDVLTMGKPEGAGCYCYVNNVLRGVVSKLIKDYDFVLIDNEAGLEHLSRRTTREADSLVVVSDSSVVGLRAAGRIADLAEELEIKIKKSFLLINQDGAGIDKDKLKGIALNYLGNIPLDKDIAKYAIDGVSLIKLNNNSPGLTALRKLHSELI